LLTTSRYGYCRYNTTFPQITGDHVLAIDLKFDGAIPLNVKCPACGALCTFTVPVIKKDVNITMPACPITSKIG
jgi:hypothetical protein